MAALAMGGISPEWMRKVAIIDSSEPKNNPRNYANRSKYKPRVDTPKSERRKQEKQA